MLLPVTTAHADRAPSTDAVADLLDYAQSQNSTGLLVIQNGRTLAEHYWPAPQGDRQFAIFLYGRTDRGDLLEDVASQQKSFVAVLVAIAIDKGLIDVGRPVSDYIGKGWSKASPEQEAKIRVIDVLTMSSGLDDQFGFVAPVGTLFHYNTPVYAVIKRVVSAAAKQPLETVTREWLTVPAGMNDTAWRKRPAALAGVGNDTGLVTTPRDVARFGLMVLHGGVSEGGMRVVSATSLKALFTPSATNPAYGRLWWLNGGAYAIRATGERADGPLIPTAPGDMVGALGALDRRLYVVPSRNLVVVRTGASVRDKDFDRQLWIRLNRVIG
jgi:CubicO group peptidase (beta-lactamase class C family)